MKAVRPLDLDRSGALEESELAELNRLFDGAPEGPLAPLDRNGDGDIDANEAATVRLPAAKAPPPQDFDRDKSGRIEGEEVEALRRKFSEVSKGPIRKLDKDGDGQLSDAEVAALNDRLARQSGGKSGKSARNRKADAPAAAQAAPDVIPAADRGTGTARLSWTPPTQNADGTPLRDLSGYVVRYGRSPSALNRREMVGDPRATEFVVEGLGAGKWYFAVSAVTKSGAESAAGKVVSKTIEPGN